MLSESIVFFLQEMGMLKKRLRTGWDYFLGKNPESLAEHTCLTAIIGYILAKMENHPNPYEVVTACVFHEIAETRTQDLDYIAQQYCQRDEASALADILSNLVPEFAEDISRLWHECGEVQTQTGIIAKDADRLECAFHAYQMILTSPQSAQQFLDILGKSLRTESAQLLLTEMLKHKPEDWVAQMRENLLK